MRDRWLLVASCVVLCVVYARYPRSSSSPLDLCNRAASFRVSHIEANFPFVRVDVESSPGAYFEGVLQGPRWRYYARSEEGSGGTYRLAFPAVDEPGTLNLTVAMIFDKEVHMMRITECRYETPLCQGQINDSIWKTHGLHSLKRLTFSTVVDLVGPPRHYEPSRRSLPLCSRGMGTRGRWVARDPSRSSGRPGDDKEWVRDIYVWSPDDCQLRYFSRDDTLACFQKKGLTHIAIVGDSIQRNIFYELISFLSGPKAGPPTWTYPQQRVFGNVTLSYVETWGYYSADALPQVWNCTGKDFSSYKSLRKGRVGTEVLVPFLRKHRPQMVMFNEGLHAFQQMTDLQRYSDVIDRLLTDLMAWTTPEQVLVWRSTTAVEVSSLPMRSNPGIVRANQHVVNKISQVGRNRFDIFDVFNITFHRRDRTYDGTHFFPSPNYRTPWHAFPRLLGAEILLLFLNHICN